MGNQTVDTIPHNAEEKEAGKLLKRGHKVTQTHIKVTLKKTELNWEYKMVLLNIINVHTHLASPHRACMRWQIIH